ncbi:MAG: amidase [Pseudomonadota bacterium]
MSVSPFTSATELARNIRDGLGSAREALELCVERYERLNPDLNAIVQLDLDNARQAADAADRAVADGTADGPLHGVPMTVKEAFDVTGLPTTWGYETHRHNVADADALAVQRLRAAGAVVFGKTNVPVALSDWQTFNPVYGTTNNPWDPTRTPGGSSGGSAAALAAGLSYLEIGSDIGASIRNPAHYCGVFGHKPTFGIANSTGHWVPPWTSTPLLDIAVIGPLARSAADLGVTLDAIAGPDAIDGAGWQLRLPTEPRGKLSDFRVGLILSDPQAEVDASIQRSLETLGEALRNAGATVEVDAKPAIDTAESHRVYVGLLRAATSQYMAQAEFAEHLKMAASLNHGDSDYPARMYRSSTMRHREWLALNETRYRMRHEWARWFETYDLLLCPAATTVAFPHNQSGERWERMLDVNGQPQPTTTPLFWAGYSGHVYLPSTVAPLPLTASGLPAGVQIIGPQYHDHRCIRFAGLIEELLGGFVAPPAYAESAGA